MRFRSFQNSEPWSSFAPSAGPAGPVWPEWLKYGPIEMITGVFAVAPLGRRTSACSVTPSEDGIQASDQSASGYATPEAPAAAGIAAREATDRTTATAKRYMTLQRRRGCETSSAVATCEPVPKPVPIGPRSDLAAVARIRLVGRIYARISTLL